MMYTPKRPKTKRNYIDHSAYTSTFEIENDQVQFPFPQQLPDKENQAKQILFSFGENQIPFTVQSSRKHCPAIDSWINPLNLVNQQGRNRPIQNIRNTYSVQGQVRRIEVFDENNIIKLKQALKKLESPQKKTNKNEKTGILQKINQKRSKSTKVADLIKGREGQSQNQSRNPLSGNKIVDRHQSSRNSFLQGNKFEHPPHFQNTKFKQARKNRTLRNILQ